MAHYLKVLLHDLAAVLLGMTLTFAFAPYEVFPLAVLVPAGLLGIWLTLSPKQAFITGFLFGLGLFGAGAYWVYISVNQFGGVVAPLAFLITAGMMCILALYPGATGYVLNRYFPINSTAKIVFAFPALWLISEWLRSFLLSGFTWFLLGYSQTNSPLKGYAPIFSVYGISLALVLTSALIVSSAIKYRQQAYRSAYIHLLIIVTIWVGGGLCALIPWTKPTGEPVAVSLVQGAIPQDIKWSPESIQVSLDRYEALTKPLWGKHRLIIWPESAIPLPLPDAAYYIQKIDDQANASHDHLILGIPIQSEMRNGYYNGIVTLGGRYQAYLKRHLVPFGEYIPFSPWLYRLLNYMNIPVSDLLPGNRQQGLLSIGDLKILPAVCYEITFPLLMQTNDKSINLLLTLTNDAWFGKSNAQAQHLQMAAMRALEFKRPALVVSNDGITAIINADGQIESQAPPYQPYVLNGTVQPSQGITPWMVNGIDPMLFIMMCFLFIAIQSKRRSSQTKTVDLPIAQQPSSTNHH